MKKDSILLNEGVLNRIREHAAIMYPDEACGILLSTAEDERITGVYFSENNAEKAIRRERFDIDPLTLYELEKKAGEEGFNITGYFHSHPDHMAVPSGEDIRYMIPGVFYMIVPVAGGECGESRGYRRDTADGEIYEIKIKID